MLTHNAYALVLFTDLQVHWRQGSKSEHLSSTHSQLSYRWVPLGSALRAHASRSTCADLDVLGYVPTCWALKSCCHVSLISSAQHCRPQGACGMSEQHDCQL
jgi:hypothetical protein